MIAGLEPRCRDPPSYLAPSRWEQNTVMSSLVRKPAFWIVTLLVLALLLSVALYLFQPWRLFTNRTVDESLPSATSTAAPSGTGTDQPAGPRTLATGTFITHEHDTSGTAKVVELADGKRVLRIENLKTSDGPDLRVWLSDQEVKEGTAGWRVFDDGKYVELGKLKGNEGNQNYPIPEGTDIDELSSVAIWCKRFSVSFGAAALESKA